MRDGPRSLTIDVSSQGERKRPFPLAPPPDGWIETSAWHGRRLPGEQNGGLFSQQG